MLTFDNIELAAVVDSPAFQSRARDSTLSGVRILTPTDVIKAWQQLENPESVFPGNLVTVHLCPFKCMPSNFETILPDYQATVLATFDSLNRLKAMSTASTKERDLRCRTAVNFYFDKHLDDNDVHEMFEAHLHQHLVMMKRQSQVVDRRKLALLLLYGSNVSSERLSTLTESIFQSCLATYSITFQKHFMLDQSLYLNTIKSRL